MDRITLGQKLPEFLKKYRYAMLVVLAGLVLMLMPTGKERDTPAEQSTSVSEEAGMEQRLEEILARIEGVGQVKVLLTERTGESILYQTDQDLVSGQDSTSDRKETVIITDENRAEQGLVRQIIPPVYQGAVVVCQGGGDPSVRLAVVEAVSDATGLGADKISVLKMK